LKIPYLLNNLCIKYPPKIADEVKTLSFGTFCTQEPTIHPLCSVTPE
jgi:hypothetical protein